METCSNGDVLKAMLSEGEEKEAWESNIKDVQWFRKRRTTTYVCILYALIYSMDYSCIITSLLFYLKQDVRVNSPSTWYSVVMTMVALSSTLSSIFTGKFVDKTRCLRSSMQFFIILSIVGNVLYTFHQSVWFLVIGRFMCGLIDACQSAISGEFSRNYEEKELLSVLTKYQSFYAVGFVLGPCLPALFGGIDLQLGVWVLNQNNFVGVFMAICLLILLVATTFGVHDLSKHEIMNEKIKFQQKSESLDTKAILTDFDLVLLIVSSGYLISIATVLEMVLNFIVILEYKWILVRLAVIISICTVVYFVFMNFIAKRFIYGRVKCIYFVLFPASCFSILLVGLPIDVKINKISFQELHVVVVSLLNIFVGLNSSVFARAILFDIVPKENASYCEGIRSGVTRLFTILAFALATWIYRGGEISIPILASISLLFVYPLMLSKRLRPMFFNFCKSI